MTDRRIQILPTLLSNQIAAGEVVERPASIVKELIENSIDAGAKHIEVRVEEGGMQAITITDDGTGILKEDLVLSITPHATSKIYSLDELENLQSLGFRGEALASIASVSRFMLKSRHVQGIDAWQVEIEGKDHAPEVKPTSLLEGTKIEVRDLFFNTPARRKFLKAQATEFHHIEEAIRKIALSHMDIEFKLYHNHKEIFNLEAENPKKRLDQLCGKGFADQSLFIQVQKTGLSLEGWLVEPKFLKRSAEFQYFYVNGRPIRDKLIIHAVKEAYRDVLYGDHQPQYILFLEVDPRSVDFNVHPAKLEVRFREGRLIHDFIYSEVKRALSKPQTEFCHDKIIPRHPDNAEHSSGPSKHYRLDPVARNNMLRSQDDGLKALHLPFDIPTQTEEKPSRFGKVICQLKGLFILAENEEGLVIIDMHAAHERVLYERLKKNWREQHWECQMLLIPHVVELSKAEEATFKEHREHIKSLGFGIDEWIDHQIMIREVPVTLSKANLDRFMHDLLKDLDLLGHSSQIEIYLDQILAEVACHSAIQAHQPLSFPEMNQLLKDMEETPNIEYCNHGRPTSRILKVAELDRLFLRGR